MIYILSAAVIPSFGSYLFEQVSTEHAIRLLETGSTVTSAVGHDSTAVFLSRLLRMPIVPNRIKVSMAKGDEALVLRLGGRLPEGKILSDEEISEFPFELGWLVRTA